MFTLKILLAIFSIILTFILTFFVDKESSVIWMIYIGIIFQFFNVLNMFFSYFFSSFNRMDYEAIGSFLERIITLISGLYVLYYHKSLYLFLICVSIAYFLKFIYMISNLRHKVLIRFNFDIKLVKKLLSESYPYFLSGFFIFIYFKIDTVMLSLMIGDEVTGWYNSAYRLIDTLSLIPSIIVVSILPSMSKLYKENKKLLIKLFTRVFRYLVMLILPITVGTIILAERIIFFIYGKSFIGGSISLQILIVSELFLFVNYLMGYLLNSIDKQKYFTFVAGICVLFNISLNFLLIPKFSYIGAGIATVATELLNFFLLKRYVGLYLTKIKLTLPILKSIKLI